MPSTSRTTTLQGTACGWKTKPKNNVEHIWEGHKPNQSKKKKKENLVRQLKTKNRTRNGNYVITNFLNSYFSTMEENLA